VIRGVKLQGGSTKFRLVSLARQPVRFS
jgi:hypothetical protein